MEKKLAGKIEQFGKEKKVLNKKSILVLNFLFPLFWN